MLRVGGILIKVLPREGYLCQLRALAAKGAYSNRDVLARMDDACAGGFAPLVRRAVTYTRPLPAGLRGDAVRMSPLSHREAAFDAAALQALTIDLEIAVLRRSA